MWLDFFHTGKAFFISFSGINGTMAQSIIHCTVSNALYSHYKHVQTNLVYTFLRYTDLLFASLCVSFVRNLLAERVVLFIIDISLTNIQEQYFVNT